MRPSLQQQRSAGAASAATHRRQEPDDRSVRLDRRPARPLPESQHATAAGIRADQQSRFRRSVRRSRSNNIVDRSGHSTVESGQFRSPSATPAAATPPATTPPASAAATTSASNDDRHRSANAHPTETEESLLHQLRQRLCIEARPATASPSPSERRLHTANARLRMRQSVLPEESFNAASTPAFGSQAIGGPSSRCPTTATAAATGIYGVMMMMNDM